MTQFLMVRQSCQCWPRFFPRCMTIIVILKGGTLGTESVGLKCQQSAVWSETRHGNHQGSFLGIHPSILISPITIIISGDLTTITLQKASVSANKSSKVWIPPSQKYFLNIQHNNMVLILARYCKISEFLDDNLINNMIGWHNLVIFHIDLFQIKNIVSPLVQMIG